jgi:glyoxylase-like metal-dependent hydrolase (beta-lactamase superfamily II)
MRKLTDKVYQIPLGLVNAFLIDSDGLTLIDTGYKGSADSIFKAISKAGKNPKDIRRIILTHLHKDHAGSAAEIRRRLNIPVLAHEADALLIEKGAGGRPSYIGSPGLLNWLAFNLFIKGAPMDTEPVRVDQQLKDQQVLDIAGGIKIIHTPGHTKGHIALLIPEENLLIAGDLCANMFGMSWSVIYEDMDHAKKSIGKVAQLDFDQAVFGHGKPIRRNAKMKFEKFYHTFR